MIEAGCRKNGASFKCAVAGIKNPDLRVQGEIGIFDFGRGLFA